MNTPAQPPAKPAQPSLGCLLLLNLVGISLIGGFLWARAGREKAQVEAAWAKEIGPFTADALCKTYDDNPLMFEDIKEKCAMIVTGPIHTIDVDFSGAAYITLGAGLLGGVRCTFEQDQRDGVKKLRKGQEVTAKGIFEGRDAAEQVQLIKCRLMPAKGK